MLDPLPAGRFSLIPMLRLVLILALILSASLAGAVASERVVAPAHEHHAIYDIETDAPMCCENGIERAHSCTAMPGMFEHAAEYGNARTSDCIVFERNERVLIGVPPSDLLDPPRLV